MANIDKQSLKFIYLTSGKTPSDITGKNDSDIIFYSAKHQIIVNGEVFGVTDDQATAITNATSGIQALNERVEMSAQLSITLLEILRNTRSKLDGATLGNNGIQGAQSINVGDASITNTVNAINKLYELVSNAEAHAGVQSVNGQQGVVTLTGADIAVSTTNSTKIDVELGKKVDISTDTTVGTNSGKKASDYTNTKVIGDAIEAAHSAANAAHAAANAADTAAGNKIAKSPTDTTAKTISGAQGSALTDAAAIATAIETACDRLLKDSTDQAQTNWDKNEKKTLTTLRDLIAGLRSDVNGITGTSLATIQNAITAIKNELGGEEGGEPRNLIGSFLDAVATILPIKNNDNTYTFNIGTGTGATTATTIQGVINDLVGRITAAAAAGVTSLNSKTGPVTIANGTGTVVDNSGSNIVINATAAATTTAALTQSQNGYGATTVSGSTIQTALQDINDAASSAGKAANDAQTDATTALNQLKWVVV